VTFTDDVADGMHGAIVKGIEMRERGRAGLPVREPVRAVGCG